LTKLALTITLHRKACAPRRTCGILSKDSWKGSRGLSRFPKIAKMISGSK
jgi:hypothetical protein